MISVMTAFIIKNAIEIGISTVFLMGFGVFTYFKLRWKTTEKLVFYDITDRIIKSKKIQQTITNRVGGNQKDGTFFKAS